MENTQYRLVERCMTDLDQPLEMSRGGTKGREEQRAFHLLLDLLQRST